jgi:hypothetical protein
VGTPSSSGVNGAGGSNGNTLAVPGGGRGGGGGGGLSGNIGTSNARVPAGFGNTGRQWIGGVQLETR